MQCIYSDDHNKFYDLLELTALTGGINPSRCIQLKSVKCNVDNVNISTGNDTALMCLCR